MADNDAHDVVMQIAGLAQCDAPPWTEPSRFTLPHPTVSKHTAINTPHDIQK